MTEILGAAIGHGQDSWEWRNGMLDSSGEDSGPRQAFFDAFPATAARRRIISSTDLFGATEYRFWFLVARGRAHLAIEPSSGSVYVGDAVFDIANDETMQRCVEIVGAAPPQPPEGENSYGRAARLREDFETTGIHLASQVAFDAVPFLVEPALSAKAVWLTAASDSQLVVVSGRHERKATLDEVLAYALVWQGDRDLILIIPKEYAQLTIARLAWIDSPVRVFVYGNEFLARPTIIPSREEVLTEVRNRELRKKRFPGFGEAGRLVEELVLWADSEPALVAGDRHSYQAWHCEGTRVLTLTRSGSGVKIVAGLTGRDLPTEAAVREFVVTGEPLSALDFEDIKYRVSEGIRRRKDSWDGGYVEHRFQSNLSGDPICRQLGLKSAEREYPLWRDERRGGFIDFLGVGLDDRFHVIETKVDPEDVTVVLQGLDYYIWITANAPTIRTAENLEPPAGKDRVVLDFIFAPRVKPGVDGLVKPHGFAIGKYTERQLNVLSGDIKTRVFLSDNPLAKPAEINLARPLTFPLTPGSLIDTPMTEPRWGQRIQEALRSDTRKMHRSVELAFLPSARPALAALRERGLDHRWVLSVRSSQALALNLFAPLEPQGMRGLFKALGLLPPDDVRTIEMPAFEWSNPEDRLGEMLPLSQHPTQIDVVLRATWQERRMVALIEVKFTEDFSGCSAYEDADNPSRDVCRSAGLFGDQPERCFKLSNHGAGRRLYDTYLSGIPVRVLEGGQDSGGCLVREHLNQPMRSLALGRLLLDEGDADEVAYVVCAPRGHMTSWRRLAELQTAFTDTEELHIRGVFAETVANYHPDGGAGFRALYPAQEMREDFYPPEDHWDPDEGFWEPSMTPELKASAAHVRLLMEDLIQSQSGEDE